MRISWRPAMQARARQESSPLSSPSPRDGTSSPTSSDGRHALKMSFNGSASPGPGAMRAGPTLRDEGSHNYLQKFRMKNEKSSSFQQTSLNSPHENERAETPQTIAKKVGVYGMRWRNAIKMSSPGSASPLRGCESPLPGTASPKAYTSNPAKHILNNISKGAASSANTRLDKQTSKASLPETHESFVDAAAKENTSPKVLPVFKPQGKIQEEGGAEKRDVGKSVKSLEMANKTTAEMNAEMMHLFEEAKRSGCIIEVRSVSKHPDSSEDPEIKKERSSAITLSKNVRSKSIQEMHSEMMKLFEEAKELGSVIEVTERPHEDDLFRNQVVAAPLTSASMVNKVVRSPGRIELCINPPVSQNNL